jgi:Xaa-Pro dipeptidase
MWDATQRRSPGTAQAVRGLWHFIVEIFSQAEIERRWAALWKLVTEVDAVVTTSFHNSYYLSGFPMSPWGRYAITVLFRNSDPVLIVPRLEEAAARGGSPIKDCRTYNDDEGPNLLAAGQLLMGAIAGRKVEAVGIDADAFPHALAARLAETVPVRNVGEAIDLVRLVSSDEELAYIREAIRMADFGMEQVVERVRPGIDEALLCEEIRLAMLRDVQLDAEVDTICVVQQGERQSSRCHRGSSHLPIAGAQTLQAWCESYVWHYCGNIERCLILGDASREVRRGCDVALAAYEAAAELVRPGKRFSEIDAAARHVLTAAGYTDIPTGSGLVRSILSGWGGRIDGGNLRPYNDRLLRSGMVLSVEPWAVISGVGAPHLATTLLVNETGHEVLNRFPSVVPYVA